MLHSQAILNMTLFNFILRSDDTLRTKAVDVLRQLQINPSVTLSPELSLQITGLRELLISEPPPEVVAASQQPHLRPVE
jgi:hypothetical protein